MGKSWNYYENMGPSRSTLSPCVYVQYVSNFLSIEIPSCHLFTYSNAVCGNTQLPITPTQAEKSLKVLYSQYLKGLKCQFLLPLHHIANQLALSTSGSLASTQTEVLDISTSKYQTRVSDIKGEQET